MNVENSHPSYATITASHTSGSPVALYGCSTDQYNYITVEVATAGERRNILRLSMSKLQFAQFVAGVSRNEVPCTLCRVNGYLIPQPKSSGSKLEAIRNELKGKCDEIKRQHSALVAKREEFANKPGAKTKAEQKQLLDLALEVVTNATILAPHLLTDYAEAIEEMTAEADLARK